jgi:tetratricopeptide (TPR) repeat protein
MTFAVPRNAFLALLLACAAASAQSVDDLLDKGDAFDRRFEAADALSVYLIAEKADPKNVDILLRIARQYRHLLQDAKAKKEKLQLGRLALSYAQRAAALAPDNAETHLSIAISYGKMLPFMATKEQVETSPRIKNAVDRTLQLDPRNDSAWHILGRWNRTLAEISGLKRALAGTLYGSLPKGSKEEAAKCLEKAIALNPNRLMHYIELGRIYALMGRKNDARKFINKGMAMPDVEKDDPEMKAKGRETLEKLR